MSHTHDCASTDPVDMCACVLLPVRAPRARAAAVGAQVGDIFDRGDDDLAIEEWLYVLSEQVRMLVC
jgi:hypothetical protein